jgi:signal transduction histidine kinase
LKINLAYEKIIGVKAEDILDKTAKYISPNQELHWLDVPDRVSKTGISEHVELYNKDINKTLDCYYFLYSKNIVGTLFRDISERKKMEKQLQDQERLAAIGATAGMVGHDIRNPLQAISGDLYFIKKDLSKMPDSSPKENVTESLQAIESSVAYINKIVQDLQDYTRPIKLSIQEIDLEELCKEQLSDVNLPNNLIRSCQVNKEVKTLKTDRLILKRILNNLTINAVQAMPDGGKLTLSAYRDAKNIVIVVADTGVGIPPEVQPKLFTPTFTTKAKGQGFGLAVVKRMTEVLGGTVTFESQEGKGTKFIIELPLQTP